jgi:hypothetical protein
MRDDMFKVIVERPRWGSRWIESAKLDRNRDRDGGFVGLQRYAQEQTRMNKGFSDNLAPLARFLRARCGRRWDDVYAEICASLDTGSTVKMHVRQHLDDLVNRRISYGRHGELLNDGHLLERHSRRSVRDDLYVDPDDGILKDAATFWGKHGLPVPSRRSVRARPARDTADLRRIDDTHFAWRRGGYWYLVAFDHRPHLRDDDLLALLVAGGREAPMVHSQGCRPMGEWMRNKPVGPPPVWQVVALRQLGKRDLRRYDLTGDCDD